MSEETLWILIAKHFAGECIESEGTILNQWLSNESNLNRFKTLKQQWNEQRPDFSPPIFDLKEGWQRLQSKLE